MQKGAPSAPLSFTLFVVFSLLQECEHRLLRLVGLS